MISVSRRELLFIKYRFYLYLLIYTYLFTEIGYVCIIIYYQVYSEKE